MRPEQRHELNQLMIRFADGDRSAFQPLFDRLWPLLLAFTTRSLPSGADAEDAAQQALLKVFARIVDYDRDRDAAGWALAIAGYEVLTARRQSVRRRVDDGASVGDLHDASPDQEERVIREQLHETIVALAGELSANDQAALAHLLAGEPGPTDETSRKRRLRALERLRTAWRRVHG